MSEREESWFDLCLQVKGLTDVKVRIYICLGNMWCMYIINFVPVLRYQNLYVENVHSLFLLTLNINITKKKTKKKKNLTGKFMGYGEN